MSNITVIENPTSKKDRGEGLFFQPAVTEASYEPAGRLKGCHGKSHLAINPLISYRL